MRYNPDNAPEKQAEYKTALEAKTDEALFAETEQKIWLSAFAANNPISCYHWQADATYDEWNRRGKIKEYSRAHAKASRQ